MCECVRCVAPIASAGVCRPSLECVCVSVCVCVCVYQSVAAHQNVHRHRLSHSIRKLHNEDTPKEPVNVRM